MRILLDESIPRKLKRKLVGHEVSTVPEMGWASKKNGELLRLAVGRFDVFITVDRNLQFQQNLKEVQIGVLLLVAPSNRFRALEPLVPRVLQILPEIKPGNFISVT